MARHVVLGFQGVAHGRGGDAGLGEGGLESGVGLGGPLDEAVDVCGESGATLFGSLGAAELVRVEAADAGAEFVESGEDGSRPQPKMRSARRAEPPQYWLVIWAWNRRRLWPVSSAAAVFKLAMRSSVSPFMTAALREMGASTTKRPGLGRSIPSECLNSERYPLLHKRRRFLLSAFQFEPQMSDLARAYIARRGGGEFERGLVLRHVFQHLKCTGS